MVADGAVMVSFGRLLSGHQMLDVHCKARDQRSGCQISGVGRLVISVQDGWLSGRLSGVGWLVNDQCIC